MTDYSSPMYDDMDDLELITSYLNGHLTPERAEAVRRRLEEDAAFLEFASPMILVWSVPPYLERHPRPEGEWERAWEDFVKRSGFPNRPPPERPRRRWVLPLIQVLILSAIVAVYAWREPIKASIEGSAYGRPLPYDTAWVAIGDGIQVRLTPGASVRLRRAPWGGRQWVLLDGTARFLVDARETADEAASPGRFRVRTRVGHVTAAEADFTMTTGPDTTWVTVHPFPPGRPPRLERTRVYITTTAGALDAMTTLRAGERGRMVRARAPEILRAEP